MSEDLDPRTIRVGPAHTWLLDTALPILREERERMEREMRAQGCWPPKAVVTIEAVR